MRLTVMDARGSADSVTVRFAFTSTETNVVFECSLDGASFTSCER